MEIVYVKKMVIKKIVYVMLRVWNLSLIEIMIIVYVECLKKIVRFWREYISRNIYNKDFGKKF